MVHICATFAFYPLPYEYKTFFIPFPKCQLGLECLQRTREYTDIVVPIATLLRACGNEEQWKTKELRRIYAQHIIIHNSLNKKFISLIALVNEGGLPVVLNMQSFPRECHGEKLCLRKRISMTESECFRTRGRSMLLK